MRSQNISAQMFSLLFFFIANSLMAQDVYTISIDSTTFIFGRTCYVANWKVNATLFESDFSEIVNDTVYSRGYQEPGQPPQSWNYVLSPLFPTVGTEWIGPFAGPARFVVQDYTSISVPAGTFDAYVYEITDSISGEYIGMMAFAENIGLLSFVQVFQGDTFSVVLDSYAILGGYGVFPLFVGNQWVMIEGTIISEINDASGSDPIIFSLHQNYPNPYNPMTTISYSIPKTGFVKLIIVDLLGREIKVLVNEEKPPGSYEVEFNDGKLSSGIYFYRLQAGDYAETKKMVLLK